MADEKKTDEKKIESAVKKPGLDGPIDDPGEGKVPPHIAKDTLMVKGIDPDTKQRVSVNLPALKYEFGDKAGFAKYKKIAILGGFLDPGLTPVGEAFFPDLSLEGLKPSVREQINKILKEA
jgi:hypothetical protein